MMLVTSVNFPFFASLELDLRSTTLGNASSRKKERKRERVYVCGCVGFSLQRNVQD